MSRHWYDNNQALNEIAWGGKQSFSSNGETLSGSRIQQLQVKFDQALASADVTTTTNNGASTSSAAGLVTMATGTGGTATCRIQTNNVLRYSPGRELYFAGTFEMVALPTSTNTAARFGAFDDNDGIWIGFVGPTAYIATRTGAVDTTVAQSSWNLDTLTGTSGSLFTRNYVPEAIDFTKVNLFRVRWLHYGTGAIVFEVMSPDGSWVAFHMIRRPNATAALTVTTTRLPLRAEVVKTSSDAQNVQMKHGCWDGGTVEDAVSFGQDELRGRKYVSTVLAAATSATVYVVTTGRALRMANLVLSVNNTAGQAGQLSIRDGAAGTLLESVYVNSQNITNLSIPYSVNKRVATAVYAEVVSGTLAYTVSVTGFETDS